MSCEVEGSIYQAGRKGAMVGDQDTGAGDNGEALFRKLACIMSLKEWAAFPELTES